MSIFADSIELSERADEDVVDAEGAVADVLASVRLVKDVIVDTKIMSPRRNLEKVVADLDLGLGADAGGEGEDEGDDLLDLMDGAI